MTITESSLARSLNFEHDDIKTALRSISFKGLDSESGIMKSVDPQEMVLERSVGFNQVDQDTAQSIKTPPSQAEDNATLEKVGRRAAQICDNLPSTQKMTGSDLKLQPTSNDPQYLAALRLQKTYKSFRIRRQLADCAVLVEQRWWKLLDFAQLERTSVSFFEVEKPETAVSRWSRASTRVAKVGKGLSQDEKARKLALQHWLEAIDPRHRYGHNLHFYYVKWLHCASKQPFFYWLDIGEGRELNLERCSRSKLLQQCIKYLGPAERKDYEVEVVTGSFIYKQSGMVIDTTEGPADVKWIFVLSAAKTLYVGTKKKGKFQHSSFLAGAATLSAGRLVVENGILKAVWPHSGHYLPTEENFQALMLFLLENDVDLNTVQKNCSDDDEGPPRKETGLHSSKSDSDLREMREQEENNTSSTLARRSRGISLTLTILEIPRKERLIEVFKKEGQQQRARYSPRPVDCSSDEDGNEAAEETDDDFIVSKHNLFDEHEEEYEEPVPREKIMERIASHKGMMSYQFAQQVSCRWTTGAGPRIGCVRDYPSELQFRVLEDVSLSPRASHYSPRKLPHSARLPTPKNTHGEPTPGKSPLSSESTTGKRPLASE
ncbi:IQ domain-containing protein IQM2 [Heracleum sosnowskyi]|uniref:IQ domain-containing protein IQM2 n=1 Tax=Heracleum sosnowskyi TaxID=360622 RepID=A0AAD8IIR6_9APIA|nr:IQ domain-containing protein IQM2 [Heracleum sosnowskyi]